MDNNISLLISAIKAEAEAQSNELENITEDIFAILNSCTKTVETDTAILEYAVRFECAGGYNGRRIWFTTFCKKETCKDAYIKEFSKPVTLSEAQARVNAYHEKDNENYTSLTIKAIEKLYSNDEIIPFMLYLSEKILPQFLRDGITFEDYHF